MSNAKFAIGTLISAFLSISAIAPGKAMSMLGAPGEVMREDGRFISRFQAHRQVHGNVNRNVHVDGAVGYHGGVYRGVWVGSP